MFNCRQKPLQSPINLEALLLKVERKTLHDLKHGKHDHDDENGEIFIHRLFNKISNAARSIYTFFSYKL